MDLDLKQDEVPGALLVKEWLRAQITTDRPTFSAIVNFIISDIEDALDTVEAEHADH